VRAYSVCLNLKDKKCLVVGGGYVAERKVRELLRGQGNVTVISPDLTPGLQKLQTAGRFIYRRRKYIKGDAKRYFLVIAATSDRAVNQTVAKDSTALLNVVDTPDLCNFIMPFVVEKGPLSITVSTSGISPSLAITLGEEIEAAIPKDIDEYLAYAKKIRQKLQGYFPDGDEAGHEKKMKIFREMGSKKLLKMLRDDGFAAAKKYLDEMVKEELGKRSL
jgi:precorrin-2 dehydrogenase / sirohydrochlorin ferrochelatase